MEEINNNEEKKEELKEGNGIEISNEVIAKIAGVFAGGITEVLSGKKNLAKGIKVEKTENSTKIDVNIVVEYGTRIPDIAYEIQNRVKKAVENMTGLQVTDVNVNVQGVNTDAKTKEDEEIIENSEETQE